VDSFDMKAVFLAPGLKNELLPARLVPKKTTRQQTGDEHAGPLSFHLTEEEQADPISFHLLASLYQSISN